ncbi:MAG: T9SS type A sorting domain-containing protein [Candidatus Marinimicrobia bacterium]|jgi:hypothetical protein|nr:T9SS type A sorting domain-containing protein [Candidatus Neomarinimicrobiota bacterium]
MKITKLFLTIIILVSILSAQFRYEETLFIPWGKGDTNVAFRKAPGGQYGPTSFNIIGDDVIILDAQNQTVKIFKNKMLENSVKIPFYNADDILWENENNYYILSENKVHKMKQKSVMNSYSTASGRIIISKITKDENGQISLTTNKLTTLKINSLQKGNSLIKINGIPDGISGQITAIRKNSQTAEVKLADKSSYQISVKDLGMIQYIGATPEGFKYFLIEQITQQVPLKVARYIYLMNDDGEIKAKLNLPSISFSYIFKEFSVDENGNLFQMISAKDGIHIIEWKYENKFPKIVPIIKYPEKFNQSYHYNDFEYPFLETNPALKKKSKMTASVTREDALTTADSYITCVWTGSANNQTNGIETLSGASVETPSSNNGEWWIIGPNTKVPYQWGGYSLLSEFESGVQDGQKAGDMQTSGLDGNNAVNYSDVEGVDCSGYVSRCWTSGRYSTSTFDQVSYQLSKYDDLLPADAVNNAGSHIRLFVERNPSGSLLMAEAAGSGWACRYASFEIISLSSYVPIRYDNITGGTTPKPTLNSVLLAGNNFNISWDCLDTASTSGYNIYRYYEGGSWEKYSTVNSSTLVKTGSAGDGVATFFNVKSIEKGGSAESIQTDTYGVQYASNNSEKFLIVDGFDRTDGDYSSLYHEFAKVFGMALGTYKYSFNTVANEKIISGVVNLNDYDAVFWNLGDESTADETFNSTEQTKVTNYLKQGGKLLVSGSEIGWDLDNKGSTENRDFYNNYLKADYVSDDSEDYSVYGESGTVFDGLTINFDDGTHSVYNVNWPDVINTSGGSSVALRYNSSEIAAVQFSGTVSGGTSTCKIINMGFPFETIYTESERVALIGKVLNYFGFDDTQSSVPKQFELIGNYPNPFNNSTVFKFYLPSTGNVTIDVYNVNGQRVATAYNGILNTGTNNITFTSNNLSSGIYIYRIKTSSNISQGKMMLIK